MYCAAGTPPGAQRTQIHQPGVSMSPAGSSSWIKHTCRYFFSRVIIMNKFEAGKGNADGVFITIFQEKQPSFDGRCGNIKRNRRLLYLSPRGKHLLTDRLEKTRKSSEDKFPSTAKGCPGMSHSGMFQPNSHQGI